MTGGGKGRCFQKLRLSHLQPAARILTPALLRPGVSAPRVPDRWVRKSARPANSLDELPRPMGVRKSRNAMDTFKEVPQHSIVSGTIMESQGESIQSAPEWFQGACITKLRLVRQTIRTSTLMPH